MPRRKTGERTAGLFDKKLGARIRAQRLAIAMSQEALAEKLGVTFQQVQKYEKGMNRVAASTLLDVAEALKTPVLSLLPGAKPQLADRLVDDPDLSRLLALARRLNPAGRRMLTGFARTLSKDPKLARAKRPGGK